MAMNCPNCGEKVSGKYDFCLVCGNSLHSNAEKKAAPRSSDASSIRKRLKERLRQVTAHAKTNDVPQQTQQTDSSATVQDDRIMPDFMTRYL